MLALDASSLPAVLLPQADLGRIQVDLIGLASPHRLALKLILCSVDPYTVRVQRGHSAMRHVGHLCNITVLKLLCGLLLLLMHAPLISQ